MTNPENRRQALQAMLAEPRLVGLLALLNAAGEEARIIGGAVRNCLLGEEIADIDIATTALPDEVIRRATVAGLKSIPTGIAHGTVTILCEGQPFEITTLREDISTDGRRATVRFGRNFRADALRRDFTINALALTADGELVDYCDGLADLALRRVCFIGDAQARITEDYLRTLRFFRFHARFGQGQPDAAGLQACVTLRHGLDSLSRERVRAELLKLLAASGRNQTVAVMAETGIWQSLTGGIAHLGRLRGLNQDHDPLLALATLEITTREDALRLQNRLRLSSDEAARLWNAAVALEKLGGFLSMPDAHAIRRTAFDLGREAVADALHIAGSRFESLREALVTAARTVPISPFRGAGFIEAGVPAGPQVGLLMRQAEADWSKADFPEDPEHVAAIMTSAIARSRR